jgi:hypothetical protein
MRDSRELITSAIAGLRVFNHHEHAWQSFSVEEGQEFDLPYFLYRGYLASDLAAAGLRLDLGLFDYLADPQLPDGAERAWQVMRPFLDRVRTTSYFRYLVRSLRELLSVTEAEIFSDQWRRASDRIRAYSQQHKGGGSALSARMGVTATVLDAKLEPERMRQIKPSDHCLLHVARLDMFIHEERGLAATLDKYHPPDFESWLAAFDEAFHRNLEAGAVGLKSGLAYNRRIEYTDPTIDEVARIFKSGLRQAAPADKTPYQDFMMNRLCRLCVEADVPLQIHTGLQGGIGHRLEDTRPTLLTSLFRRHGDLRVDLFHGGYPWYIQGGLMAKYFPNVYIDGCWLPHISPSAYRLALAAWIETVPLTKIFAWGGDHLILEHSYASLCLARELIADVLADLVDRGYFDPDLALETARRILHDNGLDFWRIAGDRSAQQTHPPLPPRPPPGNSPLTGGAGGDRGGWATPESAV